jgi:CheY-like chemotaxis protein/DNA-binding XRE family transcriptional regulator
VVKRHDLPQPESDLQARFGAEVRSRRQTLGISQEELAWRADLHRTYIADIERGGRNITLRSIASLARALEVSVAALLEQVNGPGKHRPGCPLDGIGEILMVEDNEADIELVQRAFANAKFTNPLVVVRDGAEALDYLSATGKYAQRKGVPLPQLVLLDLNLPRIPGTEVLRRIKQHERTRHIPVVVLTASRKDTSIAECRALGADAYIVKPVDFDNFSKITPLLSFQWALLKRDAMARASD